MFYLQRWYSTVGHDALIVPSEEVRVKSCGRALPAIHISYFIFHKLCTMHYALCTMHSALGRVKTLPYS